MTIEGQLTNSTAISIIYDEQENLEGSKGLRDAYDSVVKRVGVLNVATFRERLSALCLELSDTVQAIDLPSTSYSLDSFEVAVDVTAKGEVRLVGSVGSEVKGGLKLVFKKNP
jgi:hypothetical protein